MEENPILTKENRAGNRQFPEEVRTSVLGAGMI